MTLFLSGITALLFAAFAFGQTPEYSGSKAQLRGTILDVHTARQVSIADITLGPSNFRTRSDEFGRFRLGELAAGDYQLQVSSADYLPFTSELHLDVGEEKELQVSLVPRLSARVDAVSVEGNLPPDATDPASLDRVSLRGEDLKNLGTVLADDPLRAVQGLPGVTANDDFGAKFSLRGADFGRIGIYLDGIKLHNAIHSLEGTDLSGSASSFNSALVGQLDLYEAAYSEQFADSSAGALEVRLRDGNPDRYSFNLAANLGTAGATAGGPFGSFDRCSWIAGYRKSYLQYLLARTLTDPSLAFGIEDAQGRASCRVSTSNTVSLDLSDSHTTLDRSSLKATLGANALMFVNQHALTANLSWLYSPSDRLQVATHAAWMTDNFAAKNPILEPLGLGSYREKVSNTTATWLPGAHYSLNAGFSIRALGENGFSEAYNTVRAVRLYEPYRGSGILSGEFLGGAWTGLHDYLHVTASGRWDHHSIDGVTAFSPQAGLSLKLLSSLTLQAGWGQYAQFPEPSVFGSNRGSRTLLPIRSIQTAVALEQRLPWNARLKVGLYNRQDRDLVFQPTAEPRVIGGSVLLPPLSPLYTNSLRGRSRGVEINLQRASTSGVGGWVSYSYGKTWMHDGITDASFPSYWDQRHTVNAYLSYRLRPSVNLSARWTYGSGLPVPGFFRLKDGSYYLDSDRNRLRLGPYQRLDVRVNKTWRGEKWKKSLYTEVMNLSNKTNYRFGSLDGYNPSTGLAYVTVDSMFPILPTVGFVLER